MKKFFARYLWRIVILTAALICWHRALVLSGDMVKASNSVSFRYNTGGVPSGTVEEILEEEKAPFAVWRQKNSGTVSGKEFSRDVAVQVLEVAGDAELLLPIAEMRYGFLPARGDTNVCAIDEATAAALWGSLDATGEVLIYENKEYVVMGIFARPENTILFQRKPETDDVYPYLELASSGSGTAQRQTDEFLTRYSLAQPDILTDNAKTAAVLRQLALLPALIASALLLWRAMKLITGKPATFLHKAGFVTAMAAGIAVTALAVGFLPELPVGLIPARWSDFSFWSGFINNIGERVSLNRAFGWPAPDLISWRNQLFLLLYSGMALTGLVIGFYKKSYSII